MKVNPIPNDDLNLLIILQSHWADRIREMRRQNIWPAINAVSVVHYQTSVKRERELSKTILLLVLNKQLQQLS